MPQYAEEQLVGVIDFLGIGYGSIGQHLIDGLAEPDQVFHGIAVDFNIVPLPQPDNRGAERPEFGDELSGG